MITASPIRSGPADQRLVIPATAETSASADGEHHSSRDRVAQPGAMALPAIVPSADRADTDVNSAMPASLSRSKKARRKNTNPTHARRMSIATGGELHRRRVQLNALGRLSGVPATTSAGSRVAAARREGEEQWRRRRASPELPVILEEERPERRRRSR